MDKGGVIVIHEHSDKFILGQDFAIQTTWL